MWIDTHCHIDAYTDPNPEGVLRACIANGMGVVWVMTLPEVFEASQALMSRVLPEASGCFVGAGLHPFHAHTHGGQLDTLKSQIEQTLWVGEVGLDGEDTSPEVQASQRKVFGVVLETCAGLGESERVLSIHSRRAAGPVLDMLDGGFARAVLHWFSGDATALERAVSERRWFSVNPAMVNSRSGRVILKALPRDRVLLESDGPYMQVAGKPVLPWELCDIVVPALASLWEVSQDQVAAQIQANQVALLSGDVGV